MSCHGFAARVSFACALCFAHSPAWAATFTFNFYHADGSAITQPVAVTILSSAGATLYPTGTLPSSVPSGTMITATPTNTTDYSVTITCTYGGASTTLVGLNGRPAVSHRLNVSIATTVSI